MTEMKGNLMKDWNYWELDSDNAEMPLMPLMR